MSWMPQISAETSGAWACSALRFGSETEALQYVALMRCEAVRMTRVVESDDPINASFVNGELKVVTRYPPLLTLSRNCSLSPGA